MKIPENQNYSVNPWGDKKNAETFRKSLCILSENIIDYFTPCHFRFCPGSRGYPEFAVGFLRVVF